VAAGIAAERLSPTSAANLTLERRIVRLRWLGIAVCAVAASFLRLGDRLPVVYALIATGALYNLCFGRLVAIGRPIWLLRVYAYGVFDSAVATGLIAATGGLASHFYPVYFLVVVHAAMRFGRGIALLSGTLAAGCYLLVALLVRAPGTLDPAVVLLRLGFIVMVAVFAGYLADRAHAAELALAARLDQAAALQEAGAALAEGLERPAIEQRIAEQGRALVAADAAVLELRASDAADDPDASTDGGRATAVLPRGAYLTKLVLQSGVLDDLAPPGEAGIALRALDAAGELLGADAAELPTGALLRAPLLAHGRWVGDLLLLRAAPAAPFTPADADAVRVFLHQAALALENARLYARTREQARTDALTGLANHGALKERLGEELARAHRHGRPLCALLLDLDHFKRFNDTFGHAAGDRALRAVADAVRQALRHGDYAARYGGEELAIVLPETDAATGAALAERVRVAVAGLGAAPRGPLPGALTVSIGLAAYPAHASDREALLHAADCALYLAKGRGRDRVGLADDLGPAGGADALLARLLGRLRAAPPGPGLVAELERSVAGLAALRPADAASAGTMVPTVQAITALAATIDAKDPYTEGHSRQVAALATALARAADGMDEAVEITRVAGLLHDLGKIGIPEAILHKPGSLTGEERARMRAHPEIGAQILGPIAALGVVIPLVRHHHERWDGGGYPSGLAGEAIPLGARILAICDAYDTMIADRPYRRGLGRAEALARLRAAAGTQLDPALVRRFVDLPPDIVAQATAGGAGGPGMAPPGPETSPQGRPIASAQTPASTD